MSETMIERVADRLEPMFKGFAHGDMPRAIAREVARAAIEAMREPTGVMIDSMRGEHLYHQWTRYDLIWQAAIDAALSQSPSLPTPAATPTDSANPPPVESVGPNSEAQS